MVLIGIETTDGITYVWSDTKLGERDLGLAKLIVQEIWFGRSRF